jgi:hypothetical protein
VTDADESLRQDVKQESPNEFVSGDRHRSHLVAANVIPPTKRDVVTIERDEPVVGDGDTVGVGTEIAQGVLRTSEGSFAKLLMLGRY